MDKSLQPPSPRLTAVAPFYALRHGETEWNRQGRFQGHCDIPINASGRRQAAEAAKTLAGLLAADRAARRRVVVLSSPLRRAVETAEEICRQTGVPAEMLRTDERLREIAFGAWEGLTTLEVKARFPQERRARKQDRWAFAPPGGQSHADAADAMRGLLRDLPSDGLPILVTHSGNIRTLYYLLAGYGGNASAVLPVPHGSVLGWDGRRLEWISQ
ncbi:histidine phosphatase family protein [Mesorhizobium xinjiangense]|uniref:histidine phosphatase family protein n=1 Tax=Mesorhizobium xinjiangense TaxID=2678685 RepID=UPI0018DB9368|nr:histidine phosphatase family protein [Mesorhizobium xinjiangense]